MTVIILLCFFSGGPHPTLPKPMLPVSSSPLLLWSQSITIGRCYTVICCLLFGVMPSCDLPVLWLRIIVPLYFSFPPQPFPFGNHWSRLGVCESAVFCYISFASFFYSPMVTTSYFYVSMSLLLFCSFCFSLWLDSAWVKFYVIFFPVWLISLSIMPFRSTHVDDYFSWQDFFGRQGP